MEITKENVAAVVEIMRAGNYCNQDIEDAFKAALKRKVIDVDTYCAAMDEIYKD